LSYINSIITGLTRPDAKAPIVGLEATVTGGRTVQAHKRGGEDESRERLIEESTGAVVWLWGVSVLNWIGDKILNLLFGGNFDVGTDKVLRTPFKNFMKKNPPKNFSSGQVAFIKAIKVLASVIIADAFIGLVVPPLNQKLTQNIRNKKQQQAKDDSFEKQNNKDVSNNPSFKGTFDAINSFTNAIENTNTGKLLSTDAGLISGRLYSARNDDERREIAIRDIGSIYFYMWAQGHVRNVLNYIESGNVNRLNPTTTNTFNQHLEKFIAENGGEMDVEKFRTSVLGKNNSEIKLPEGITFESGKLSVMDKFMNNFRTVKTEPLQVAKVSDLENIIKDKELMDRIKEMSKLQPLREGEAVITKQQIIDSINKAEINDPKLLDKVFGEYTKGAHKNEFKFVSNKKLYGLKQEMVDYVDAICKDAKSGKVNKDILKKAQKKNLAYNGLNFAAGFAVAAVFLSTLIPKFQYWVTKQKTGIDGFPGTHDYSNDNKNA